MQCPVCKVVGSAQLFLNKNGEIRYTRIRHYKGLDEFKKPQFEYHKVEDLEALKTMQMNGAFLSTVKPDNGQFGQG